MAMVLAMGLVVATPALAQDNEIKPVEIDARVTERNDVWWRVSWKLKLRNEGEVNGVDATITFKDSDGFPLEDTQARELIVGPGQEREFTGYALVDPSAARQISEVGVQLRQSSLRRAIQWVGARATDVEMRVVESNDTWSKISWIITVANTGDSAVTCDVEAKFLDEDGFALDDARERGISLTPGQERQVTGSTLIDASTAPNVASISAWIR